MNQIDGEPQPSDRITRVLIVIVVLAVSAAVSALPGTAGTRSASTSTTVRVTGKEFSFALSRKWGLHGTFIFRFTNRGQIEHDFKIAGKKTPLVQPGESVTLTVKIMKPGKYRYICTVPGHAAAGMKGVFTVR
jgi:uncharacterized cupredoxin-like copper-binding protein